MCNIHSCNISKQSESTETETKNWNNIDAKYVKTIHSFIKLIPKHAIVPGRVAPQSSKYVVQCLHIHGIYPMLFPRMTSAFVCKWNCSIHWMIVFVTPVLTSSSLSHIFVAKRANVTMHVLAKCVATSCSFYFKPFKHIKWSFSSYWCPSCIKPRSL